MPDMLQWWEMLSESIAGAIDESRILDVATRCSRSIGFEFFSFAFRHSLPGSKQQRHFVSNYPAELLDRYREMDYRSIDPIVKLGPRTREPVVWSDNLFARATDLWEDTKRAGLTGGLSQFGWSRGGAYSLLSLASGSAPITAREAKSLQPYLLLLSDTLTAKFQEFSDRQPRHHAWQRLTRRELQVLRGSVEGGTAQDLARTLSLSESTVNFHLQNARKKLGFHSKLEAATYASRLGLLD
jgi:DNA-binding CsgD family transcriptional regulator